MSKMIKTLLALVLMLSVCAVSYGQADRPAAAEKTATFVFLPGNDLFLLKGNETELERLYALVEDYRTEIAAGAMPVYVDGYCASLPTSKENLTTAFVRANRVKSELILSKGLTEANFITNNYARAYLNNKDIVVVTLRIPATKEPEPVKEQSKQDEAERKETKAEVKPQPEPVVEKQPQSDSEQTSPRQTSQPIEGDACVSEGRYVALKTNLAAWAGTIMNIAAEVQVGKHVSVELPVLWCPWHIGSKHAVKTFTVQPEVRYWLRQPGGGHFFGVHAHAGWFNVLWDKDRYQDTDRPLLGAGISYGYLLPFSKHWAGEFTLGAGYSNMRYDTFYNIDNGARIDTRNKNYWGITRVGLSVVYRF